MKKLLLLLFISAGLVLTSCNKDDDDGAPEEFITASIDGNSFNAATITAIADNSLGEELVFIAGTNSDASFIIGLNIPTSTPVNTTFMVDETDFAITFTDAAENAFFTVGEIELSTNNTSDNVLEGTFSFTAMDDTDLAEITDAIRSGLAVIKSLEAGK